ncbi:VOC family protein [Natronosporangium hydrolyticum]|uniref:VOC family protein n=1 Tax=Natronosporangium hydrolyticum TaxID=2811111 RepID=A0A895YH22_9ACTN|nr:VOC family protein [Natronosporangium hydrolyticum]QSB15355.1 VOC family protein [Natronosporangium hydrolyticum]
MVGIRDVVFDSKHAASLARFWAQALTGYAVAPYDDEELARLRSLGIDDPVDDPSVLVEGPPGSPRLWFQTVPESKVVKNRVHLDLATTELEAETERLLGLGARRFEPPSPEEGIVVLQDPEGNEFCVIQE